jgi:TusA-related sulfurtransferase
MKTLDLRGASSSCSDNPIVRFLRVVRGGEDLELLVIASKEDLPLGMLRIIASNNGYEVVAVKQEGAYYEAILRKRL